MLNHRDQYISTFLVLVIGGLIYSFDAPIISVVLIFMLVVIHLLTMQHLQNSQLKKQAIIDKQHAQNIEKLNQQKTATLTQFQTFVDTLSSAVLRVNNKGIIRMRNKKAQSIFSDMHLINAPFQCFKTYTTMYEILERCYIKKEDGLKQILIDDKIYNLNVTPLMIDHSFNGMMITMHDITDLKMAEQYQKNFTADVSHELRNPLSAIRGFSEIIARQSTTDIDEIKMFAQLIEKESMRLETIIKDLLTIAKMDRLDYQLDTKSVSIKQIIDDVLKVLNTKITQKGLTYHQDIKDMMLLLDVDKFKQVIHNVITNAIHYTDEGSIHVCGYVDNNNYVINVEDTGIGIEPKDQAKVFKRFYRVEAARTRDQGGSGLGLSISKNVIKKHGGTISLSSEKNKGTVITIMLPIT